MYTAILQDLRGAQKSKPNQGQKMLVGMKNGESCIVLLFRFG
jgi:hypothetical protein